MVITQPLAYMMIFAFFVWFAIMILAIIVIVTHFVYLLLRLFLVSTRNTLTSENERSGASQISDVNVNGVD